MWNNLFPQQPSLLSRMYRNYFAKLKEGVEVIWNRMFMDRDPEEGVNI